MTGKVTDKYRGVITGGVFPLLLFVYPIVGWNEGVDVMDTTFTLSHYLDYHKLDAMWKYAYWFANAAGHFLTRLPGGDTMRGMNLYTTLVISVTAVLSYAVLVRCLKMPAWTTFLGEVIAISLCWCPRVILYNYLTYFFLTCATLCLLTGLRGKEEGDLRARGQFVFAGILLGLDVFVRFSNLAQAALIVIVWGAAFHAGRSLKETLRDTLACILGYAAGLAVPVIVLILQGNLPRYAQMVMALIGMTGDAQDYSAAGMLMSIAGTYGRSAVKMWPLWVVVVACYVVCYTASILPARVRSGFADTSTASTVCAEFRSDFAERSDEPRARLVSDKMTTHEPWVSSSRQKKREDSAQHVSALLNVLIPAAAICIAIFIMYKQEVFTKSYYYYDSVFEPAMMFLICGGILCLVMMIRTTHLRFLSALTVLLLILITPLGSNNYTYPVINNLFLIAPLLLSLVFPSRAEGRSAVSATHMTLRTVSACLTLLLLVQGMLFHTRYTFRDGTDGTPRDTVITMIPRAAVMRTTTRNAVALTDLYETLRDYREAESERIAEGEAPRGIIQFGTAPGLPYLMDIDAAIFTTWPDLDTVAVRDFETALRDVNGFPAVIVKKNPETGEPDISGTANGEVKWNLLQEYMADNGYIACTPDQTSGWEGEYEMYISTYGESTR